MAETAVLLLFDKLQQLLSAEATILLGVHDEVRRIKDQLQLNKFFLKNVDMQAEAESSPDFVKEWVSQMREVAFSMEDVVDRYLLKVVERHQRTGLFGVVTKRKEKLKSLIPRHEIASEISKIRKKLGDLNHTRETTFNVIASTAAESTQRRQSRLGAHFVDESQQVGIDHNKKVLTEWLLRTESKRSMMVVVGPGGIGKTTIAKNVFHQKNQSFECYAWITVSRPQDDDMLFRAIIQNIREKPRNAPANLGIEATDPVSLVEKAEKYLKDKCYLIVFDDVWQSNFWEVVKYAIPDNTKRSRVIITTRDEGVADYCRSDSNSPVDVHRVKPLSDDDAMKLFHQKAFPFEQQGSYPEELLELSKDFVNKCNGVPLNIMAIAGLLSTKNKTFIEWQRVHDQLGSLLRNNPRLERVQQVMSESYNDLPSHLKLCFLYFGLFPEDYSISCMRLIRMWVAEGFVEERDSKHTSMEEFGEGYLAELLRRCLVQVSEVGYDGKPKSCRVHDLMHEFILTKCRGQNFCQVMKDNITHVHQTTLDSVGRRLSIHTKNNETAYAAMRSAANWRSVRSCFVFDDAKKCQITKPFFSSFELLIGLDLSDAPRLDNLPEDIGKLLNLKYLSLRNTNIRSLPKSIGKLENLQTLDLKQTQVHQLPKEVAMLIRLRHLLAYYINYQHVGLDRLQGVKLKEGLQNLTYLQKLSFLDASNAASIIEELKHLRKLRKLGIIKLEREYGEALCSAIENMTHLCSLSIGAKKNDEILKLQSLGNPPMTLQRLLPVRAFRKFSKLDTKTWTSCQFILEVVWSKGRSITLP